MKRYALFLGCTTPTKVPQYELSTRWISNRLGIDLVDIEDFVCCGSNQINLSIEAGLLLSALNLAYAEAQDLDIVTLCAACTGVLVEAVEELTKQAARDTINKQLSTIGLQYNGKTKVKHISRVIYEDVGLDKIRKEIKRDLSNLQIAPHYGCHYLRPRCVSEGLDEPDNPKSLHQLISATGAVPVEYETLLDCCGGKTFPNSVDLTHHLIAKKLDNLQDKEVDCMVLHCQTCYLMYATQQEKMSEKFDRQYNVPIILYPQLLGLAMGADPVADLGLNLNVPSVDKLLTKVENEYKVRI
jgi:heterodisulfide reductase subunit B